MEADDRRARMRRLRRTVREYDVKDGVRRVPDIRNVPWLDVLATTDSQRDNLSLFVVNRDWKQAIPATLQLKNFLPASTATVKALTSDSILTENNELHPDRVRPVSSELSVSTGLIHYKFPPHSLTVLIFDRH